MFRIRMIHDDVGAANASSLAEIKHILRAQFAGLTDAEVESVHEHLHNPFARRFKTLLFAAENASGRVLGFASLMHDPVAKFCYLDYIASARGLTSRGIGGALYQRVREESLALKVVGLFFECLPDEEQLTSTAELAQQNAARLRFYEHFGARPIIGTAYEEPLSPGGLDMPHLVYDDLGREEALSKRALRGVIRAVLERKYAGLCPPDYVERVVASVVDDPVRVRAPRYARKQTAAVAPRPRRVVLVVNEQHQLHHVRDRGYVESPVRVRSILRDIDPSGLFDKVPARDYSDRHITAVHDAQLVRYLKTVCKGVPPAKSVYPYVFPVRNAARPPKDLGMQAGYYCIDTFTPLNENALAAAREGVDCVLTAADRVAAGEPLAYALVRPPGHHAESRVFGGFCYFNNSAIAAHRLSRLGRVAIVDIDYHHGNGQQEIFYERNDVLTISIHGHPSFAYPYFSGYEEETGTGAGEGFNVNLPLPEHCDGERYAKALHKALARVRAYHADFLIIALGVDTARGDPTGSWTLNAADFRRNGTAFAELALPTLVVQEGGYRTRTLGRNVRAFFEGLAGREGFKSEGK